MGSLVPRSRCEYEVSSTGMGICERAPLRSLYSHVNPCRVRVYFDAGYDWVPMSGVFQLPLLVVSLRFFVHIEELRFAIWFVSSQCKESMRSQRGRMLGNRLLI